MPVSYTHLQCFMTMCVSALALTSLDAVARIGRMSLQELFSVDDMEHAEGWRKFICNKYVSKMCIRDRLSLPRHENGRGPVGSADDPDGAGSCHDARIILRLRKEPVLRLPGQDPPGTVAAAVLDLQLSPGDLWAYGIGHGRQMGGAVSYTHLPPFPIPLYLQGIAGTFLCHCSHIGIQDAVPMLSLIHISTSSDFLSPLTYLIP